ncbi:MAG: TrbC/VirB2 family protein [Pseudomonadota bacterium]
MSKRPKLSEWITVQHKKRFNLTAMRAGLTTIGVMAMVPAAHAQSSTSSTSYFSGLTNLVCGISTTISGPWLYAIAVVCVIIGAVGIANSESTITKYIVGTLSGLGLAASAGTLVAQGMGIAASCTTNTA